MLGVLKERHGRTLRGSRSMWVSHLGLLITICLRAKSLQSCPTLCNSVDCSLSSSSVHVTLQTGILEWVAISFSRSSLPRNWTLVSHIVERCFTVWATREVKTAPKFLRRQFWVVEDLCFKQAEENIYNPKLSKGTALSKSLEELFTYHKVSAGANSKFPWQTSRHLRAPGVMLGIRP